MIVPVKVAHRLYRRAMGTSLAILRRSWCGATVRPRRPYLRHRVAVHLAVARPDARDHAGLDEGRREGGVAR